MNVAELVFAAVLFDGVVLAIFGVIMMKNHEAEGIVVLHVGFVLAILAFPFGDWVDRLEQNAVAPRVSAGLLTLFARVDKNDNGVLEKTELAVALESSEFSAEQKLLLNYADRHFRDIGHLFWVYTSRSRGFWFFEGDPTQKLVTNYVYGIDRRDLVDYPSRVK